MSAALCSKWLCIIKQVRWLVYLIYKLLWYELKQSQTTSYSPKAKNMFKVIHLATEWLHTLFSLYWNYGKEVQAMSWLKLKTDCFAGCFESAKSSLHADSKSKYDAENFVSMRSLSLQTRFEFLSNLFYRFSGSLHCRKAT